METPVQIAISTSFGRRLTEGSRGEASDIDMPAEGRVNRGERVKRHTRSVSIRVIHRSFNGLPGASVNNQTISLGKARPCFLGQKSTPQSAELRSPILG